MMSAERAALDIRGHSMHSSPSEGARTVGELPTTPFPFSRDLEKGFSWVAWRELGHWLRDGNEPTQAPGASGRNRAAGQGIPPGTPTVAGAMALVYTQGSGRTGNRMTQLDVRGRRARFGRAALAYFGKAWTELPAGRQDIQILRPV